MLAASASTNEIKELKATQRFYKQLATELGWSKQEAMQKLANLTETQKQTLDALIKSNRKRYDSELLTDQAVDTIVKKNKRISDLELQQLEIWAALRDKAVADGKQRKDALDAAAASSSNQPPPPGAPGTKPKMFKSCQTDA